MPYLIDPSSSPRPGLARVPRAAGATARRARAVRRAVAVTWVVTLGGVLALAGSARADEVRPISPDRVHELTCGHLGTSCATSHKRSKKAKGASRKTRAQKRRAHTRKAHARRR